ncbi:S-adenosyl-L-methionine-dependent methyltransferase, partial [Cryphonectria parasitica EP155]
MPRIPPSTIRQAHHISPHAAALLPVCRDLPSALNELRWVREHVRQLTPPASSSSLWTEELHVASLCRRRGRGEPLQYILGTQPFGGLELKCRPGVFIPRPEPEAYTTHLAALIQHSHLLGPSPQSLSILDLCTGTGCIALLLYSLLARTIPDLHVHGIDISPYAVDLSKENARHNNLAITTTPPGRSLVFSQADIFSDTALLGALTSSRDLPSQPPLDVLVCNPPYVSRWGYSRQTAQSVRRYEPKIAQVPMVEYPGDHTPEDVFYARLLDIAARLGPRVLLCEVGDLGQALRVVEMAL